MNAATRILLLDNDPKIIELVSWFLGAKGFDVRTAHSFAELDERLNEGGCDLLVSDVDLGTESALVELPRRSAAGLLPRTLVVSGFLDAANQHVLTGVPEVVGTLAKPFEFEDLERAVRAALGEAPAAEVPENGTPEASSQSAELPDAGPPDAASHGAGAAEDGFPKVDSGAAEDPPTDDDDGWIEITPTG